MARTGCLKAVQHVHNKGNTLGSSQHHAYAMGQMASCACLLLHRLSTASTPPLTASSGLLLPYRGKLLNVRDATALQISENQEIQYIKQILGLQHGKQYEDVKALRYGHLMIMTDQVRVTHVGHSLLCHADQCWCPLPPDSLLSNGAYR